MELATHLCCEHYGFWGETSSFFMSLIVIQIDLIFMEGNLAIFNKFFNTQIFWGNNYISKYLLHM